MVCMTQLVLNAPQQAMTSNKPYQVYWLHLAEHLDIHSEGYVGITSKTAIERFKKHCNVTDNGGDFSINKAIRKYGADNIVIDIVCITSDEHARWLERKLRPLPFIGWNMQCGGIGNPYLTDEQRRSAVIKRNETLKERGGLPSKEKHHNWKGGTSQSYLRKHGNFVKKSKELISKEAKLRNKDFIDNGGEWVSCRPEVKLKFSEAHKKRFQELGWWVNSQANNKLWLSAAKVMVLRKRLSLPKDLISEVIGVSKNSTPKLLSKLFSGWNPLEDNRWIEFYEQNKTESDPTIEELTIQFRQS